MNEKQFNALSVEQRKAVQQKLQDAGHYTGAIDGRWGDTTKSAFELEAKALAAAEATTAAKDEKARADKLRETELALEAERLRQAGKTKDVEDEGTKAANAEKLAKLMLRQKHDEEASSGLGTAAQAAAGAPAVLTGVGAGRAMGLGINAFMDASQENKNKTLRAVAENRVKGLTTTEGARAGARLAGAMPAEKPLARVGGRMWPHLGLGTFMAGKGGLMLADRGEDDPFYPDQLNRAAGLGMIGAGTGIAERGILQGVAPRVVPDADAIAVINSSQLRRKGDAPEATPLTAKQALVAEAKAAGITGASKMNMTQLKGALAKVGGKAPLIGPAIAAGLAYGMTPDEAQAADGSVPGGQGAALTNAGVAGTTAAGAGYGLGKLLEKAPNLARALGIGAGEMAMPQMAMSMGPETDLEHQKERTAIAQNYPGLARFLGIQDEMAQLPERNMGKTDEFATARGLQIPEGIPAPNPDGSSPYPDLVSAMMANPQQAQAAPPPPMPQRRLIDAMMQARR